MYDIPHDITGDIASYKVLKIDGMNCCEQVEVEAVPHIEFQMQQPLPPVVWCLLNSVTPGPLYTLLSVCSQRSFDSRTLDMLAAAQCLPAAAVVTDADIVESARVFLASCVVPTDLSESQLIHAIVMIQGLNAVVAILSVVSVSVVMLYFQHCFPLLCLPVAPGYWCEEWIVCVIAKTWFFKRL